MKYESLFDELVEKQDWYSTISELSNTDTTLGKILDQIKKTRKYDGNLSSHEISNILLSGARVIQGALNYKCQHQSVDSNKLVICASQLAEDLYLRSSLADESLGELLNEINDDKKILNQRITQKSEQIALSALYPSRSQKSAEKILENTKSLDINFYPIANGGIMTGLDVFMRYISLSGSEFSHFSPIRFSRKKENDDFPRLTTREVADIIKGTKQRTAVLYDEDMSTGETFVKLRDFLERGVNYKLDILEIANVNGSKEQTLELLNPELVEYQPKHIFDSYGVPLRDEQGEDFDFGGFSLI